MIPLMLRFQVKHSSKDSNQKTFYGKQHQNEELWTVSLTGSSTDEFASHDISSRISSWPGFFVFITSNSHPEPPSWALLYLHTAFKVVVWSKLQTASNRADLSRSSFDSQITWPPILKHRAVGKPPDLQLGQKKKKNTSNLLEYILGSIPKWPKHFKKKKDHNWWGLSEKVIIKFMQSAVPIKPQDEHMDSTTRAAHAPLARMIA